MCAAGPPASQIGEEASIDMLFRSFKQGIALGGARSCAHTKANPSKQGELLSDVTEVHVQVGRVDFVVIR